MVGLFVFAFAQLSRFPDAKRGAHFRVYFEYPKTKAERRRHAMNSTTAPVWCKVPEFKITTDSRLDIPACGDIMGTGFLKVVPVTWTATVL